MLRPISMALVLLAISAVATADEPRPQAESSQVHILLFRKNGQRSYKIFQTRQERDRVYDGWLNAPSEIFTDFDKKDADRDLWERTSDKSSLLRKGQIPDAIEASNGVPPASQKEPRFTPITINLSDGGTPPRSARNTNPPRKEPGLTPITINVSDPNIPWRYTDDPQYRNDPQVKPFRTGQGSTARSSNGSAPSRAINPKAAPRHSGGWAGTTWAARVMISQIKENVRLEVGNQAVLTTCLGERVNGTWSDDPSLSITIGYREFRASGEANPDSDLVNGEWYSAGSRRAFSSPGGKWLGSGELRRR